MHLSIKGCSFQISVALMKFRISFESIFIRCLNASELIACAVSSTVCSSKVATSWWPSFNSCPGTVHCTKNKFSIKEFFSKCYRIRRKLLILPHLLKKLLIGNFIFCAVAILSINILFHNFDNGANMLTTCFWISSKIFTWFNFFFLLIILWWIHQVFYYL